MKNEKKNQCNLNTRTHVALKRVKSHQIDEDILCPKPFTIMQLCFVFIAGYCRIYVELRAHTDDENEIHPDNIF